MGDDMKAVFELLAKYNKLTNQDIVKILEGVDPDKLTDNVGSYYLSIMGLLNHQLQADIGWLRVLGTHISSLDFVPTLLERFPSERLPPDKLYWTTLEEFKIARSEVDSILERVVNTISASEYITTLIVEGRRGKFEYITWRILLHLFNHHTHHRGGISVLLDQLKIENDYSNLLWKV
jgi:uncharacterized damage-inducible protein DinB